MKTIVLLIVLFTQTLWAGQTIMKVRKGTLRSPDIQIVKSDEYFDYVVVSETDGKLIEKANQEFKKAGKLPPPPINLQMKMQDQVPR